MNVKTKDLRPGDDVSGVGPVREVRETEDGRHVILWENQETATVIHSEYEWLGVSRSTVMPWEVRPGDRVTDGVIPRPASPVHKVQTITRLGVSDIGQVGPAESRLERGTLLTFEDGRQVLVCGEHELTVKR